MTTKVWSLMYALGTTGRVTGDSGNPQTKKNCIAGAEVISRNGWRCWVEHHKTARRVFENPLEVAHQTDLEQKRLINFAEGNVPGFARRQPRRL